MEPPALESELGPTTSPSDPPLPDAVESPPSPPDGPPPSASAELPGAPQPSSYPSSSPATFPAKTNVLPAKTRAEARLGRGPVAGIVVAAVILALIVLLGVRFYINKKRKLALQNLPLFAPKNDLSAGPSENAQQNAPSPTGHNRPAPPKGTAPPGIEANSSVPPPSLGHPCGNLQSSFTYEELKIATDNFSEANLLGQGGFGYVHKGTLPNGEVVAIKQLKPGSRQGEREFQAEVDITSRVHHRHLVSLVGYCMSDEHRLLVYEFVPNKTLEFHLHGKGRSIMSWPIRMKIALGSARGLAYLHEDCHPKIIHRDIKAATILIDDSFEAKVADFGLAKFSLDIDTHVSTRVMGTFGYLAPEYASSGKLTEKSDTFSFGVLLLELITGRRPFDTNNSFLDDSFVNWALPLLTKALEDGNFSTFVDPRLQEYDSTEMARMVACAAACVRHSARRRPRVSQIVRALEGNIPLEDLNDGVVPGHSTAFSYGSSEYSSGQYKNDMKKFKKLALESVELGSSGFSVVSSDGGHNPFSSSTEGQQTTQEMELQKAEKDTNV